MKIAFTGAQGTGKTTLYNNLIVETLPLKTLNQLKLYESYGRKIPKEEYGLPKTQHKFNRWYISRHYFNPHFLSARSIYDTWAYSKLTAGPWFDYYKFCWAIKNIYYDHLFYVPIEFEPVADGIRSVDPEFQKDVDREIKAILDYYHVPYNIIKGSIEERIALLKSIIK